MTAYALPAEQGAAVQDVDPLTGIVARPELCALTAAFGKRRPHVSQRIPRQYAARKALRSPRCRSPLHQAPTLRER